MLSSISERPMRSFIVRLLEARVLLIVVVTGLLATAVRAQPDPPAPPARNDAQAVRATLDRLFDGMRAGDSAAVRAVFHPEARLHTVLGPSDTAAVQLRSVDEFVAAVGAPREKQWDERIWDVEVRMDGPLASAWAPYAFYLGDELSHCGVDVAQLVRHEGRWKILQLSYTRRPDCDVPAEVRK
jgi:hypothetical protein